jgi:hypothetical protein
MFTTADKAIAAILGGLVSFAALKWGIQIDWLTPDFINTISIAVAGILVYLVPNKPKA